MRWSISFGDANIVLVIGGHYHKPSAHQFRGINFIQLPSPQSDVPAVTVVHITSDRVTAIPYNYKTSAWMAGDVVFDAKLKTQSDAAK